MPKNKKQLSKKLVSLILSVTMIMSCLSSFWIFTANALIDGDHELSDGKAITTGYTGKGYDITADFTDPNLRAAVYKLIGKTFPEPIYEEDLNSIRDLDVSALAIKSLNGIEHFSSLVRLECQYNHLTSIDVSKNTNLIYFDCSKNQLSTLDVNNLIKLRELICNGNQLTSLNVKNNTLLYYFICSNNKLTELDVSNSLLEVLDCSYNYIPDESYVIGGDLIPGRINYWGTPGKFTFALQKVGEEPGDEYSPYRESKHMIFDIPSSFLEGNITPTTLGWWLSQMDKIYEAMTELTGYTPANGKKIIMIDTDWTGGLMGARGGNNRISWNRDWIGRVLQNISEGKPLHWGPIHELGHCFTIPANPNYNFQSEFTGSFLGWCAIAMTDGVSINMEGQLVVGIDDMYPIFYEIASRADGTGFVDDFSAMITCALFNYIKNYGWDAIKQAFTSYNGDSYFYTGPRYSGDLPAAKYNEFIARIGYFSGIDIRANYFTDNWLIRLKQEYPLDDSDWIYTINADLSTVTINSYTGKKSNVIIPSTIDGKKVTVIGTSAFRGNSLIQNVNVSEGVIRLGSHAFEASNLSSISLPNTLETIEDWAFCATKLTSITIPTNTRSIGNNTFFAVNSLVEIKVAADSNYFKDIDGVLFDKSGETLRAFPYAKSAAYIVPSGVKTIGWAAFSRRDKLTSITLNEGLTTISSWAFGECGLKTIHIPSTVRNIDGHAFPDSQSLTNFTVSSKNKYFCAENGVLYTEGKNCLVVYPMGKTDTYFKVPPEVISIQSGAFRAAHNIIDVDFSNANVITIGVGAFDFCERLGNIELNEGVTYIEGLVFEGCTSLNKIYIPDSAKYLAYYNDWFAGHISGWSSRWTFFDYLPDAITYNPGKTIVCHKGSSADKYALAHGFPVEYRDRIINAETPYIYSQPSNQTVTLGASVTVSVGAEVRDGGTLSYQWYKNGSLVGTSSSSYTFSTVSIGEQKLYCIVTSTNNSVSGTKIARAVSATCIVTINEPLAKKEFIFGRDTFAFTNSGRYFNANDFDNHKINDYENYEMKYDHLKILNDYFFDESSRAVIKDYNEKKKWGGSCFGMSAVMVLMKAEYLSPNRFSNKQTLVYGMNSPAVNDNTGYDTESLVNYYQIMQSCKGNGEKLYLKNCNMWGKVPNNKLIVDEIQNSRNPVVLTFDWNSGGSAHAVTAYKYEFKNNQHVITIADPNYIDAPITLTLSSDYTNPAFSKTAYNSGLRLRNTLSPDEMNDWNLQEKLQNPIRSMTQVSAAGAEQENTQTQVILYTDYDDFNITRYSISGNTSAEITSGEIKSGALRAYGAYTNEAGFETQMTWVLPPIFGNEYYLIVPNEKSDNGEYNTSIHYPDATNGFYSTVKSSTPGKLLFSYDGSVETDFETRTQQEISVTVNRTNATYSTTIVSATSSSVTVGGKINGSFVITADGVPVNLTISDGSNSASIKNFQTHADRAIVTSMGSDFSEVLAVNSGSDTISPEFFSLGKTVEFFTFGKLNVPPQTNIIIGQNAVDPKIPEIIGWYSDIALTIPYDFSTPITENITLYADTIRAADPTQQSSSVLSSTTNVNQQILLGDSDGDGKVSVKDATTVQKHVAKIITLSGSKLKSADSDEDGKVSVKDATVIQKYVAKINLNGKPGKNVGKWFKWNAVS